MCRLKKKLSCFGCLLKQKRFQSNFFFRPFVCFCLLFDSKFMARFLFFFYFCFVGLHFFFLQILLFLTLSFCCCCALVVVVVVVFVLCGLNPLLSSVLCLQHDDSKTNNTIYNNNVRNIRVLELRGAENEEGNRGEVTRWFETIGISRVRFRRVCHGR